MFAAFQPPVVQVVDDDDERLTGPVRAAPPSFFRLHLN
jgi:hypothetical protein